MDRIKSICIEEELCQSHDGSLEQILKQMLSYKKLYNVILRAEKGETYNSIKNRYSLGFLEETDLGSKMEIEFQTDSFEILSKQLIEYGSGIEIVQPDELKCITRKHLAQITNHCLNLIRQSSIQLIVRKIKTEYSCHFNSLTNRGIKFLGIFLTI